MSENTAMFRLGSEILRTIQLVLQWLFRAIRQPQKETLSFQKLPTETIVQMMCHSKSDDLRRFILTEKWIYEIFKCHKTSIFRRMQEYQVPEFSGWFGDLPGFDGSIPDHKRTPQQIQCLEDAVYVHCWSTCAVGSLCEGARRLLYLLEKYGGWRYLFFLEDLQHLLETQAHRFFLEWHDQIADLDEGLAKAVTLCLSRLSWNAIAVRDEVEMLSDVRTRIKGRTKAFAQEPDLVQILTRRTVKIVLRRIAERLQLVDITTWYHQRMLPTGNGPEADEEGEKGLDDISSETLAHTLLATLFHFGFPTALQLCQESGTAEMDEVRSWIRDTFWWNRQQRLRYLASLDFIIDPANHVGWLWAAGLGITSFDWIRIRIGEVEPDESG